MYKCYGPSRKIRRYAAVFLFITLCSAVFIPLRTLLTSAAVTSKEPPVPLPVPVLPHHLPVLSRSPRPIFRLSALQPLSMFLSYQKNVSLVLDAILICPLDEFRFNAGVVTLAAVDAEITT